MGERGQVTIPKEIRDKFGLGPETALPNEKFCDAAEQALEAAATSASLVVCASSMRSFASTLPASKNVMTYSKPMIFALSPLLRETCFVASRVWRADRRQGGQRTRILADFWIGAHAQT